MTKQQTPTSFRWGTVTGTSGGLRIRLDGEHAALPYPVDSIVAVPLQVDDRVWCQLHGTRVIVLGKGGQGAGGGRLTVTSDDEHGNILTLKAGPTADHAYIALFADSQAQGARSGYIGYPGAGLNLLRIANEMSGGDIALVPADEVQLFGRVVCKGLHGGILYPDATVGGGAAHSIAFRWNSSSQIVGTVDNAVAAVVGQVSSGKYKTDVRAVDSAIETVRALRPVVYTPLGLDGRRRDDAGEHIGLIAEEVQETLPSAVLRHPDTDEPMSVNYLEVVPLLVAAVQEQQTQIDALAARVAALEGDA